MSVQSCTVLYCTVLYVLYCTVLYVLYTMTSREEDGAQSAVPDWLEAELKEAETEDKLNR